MFYYNEQSFFISRRPVTLCDLKMTHIHIYETTCVKATFKHL